MLEHRVEIFNEQRNVHGTNVARSKIYAFTIRRREILEQFDLVTARRFQDRKLDLSAFNAGDLLASSPF